ncbi:hypothetical protein YTPLAS73_06140 [Nitrosarchaeum sp.]|nr:hypothetical protein YTPLAS73_06140 [Nitrosarchaeum sp.]
MKTKLLMISIILSVVIISAFFIIPNDNTSQTTFDYDADFGDLVVRDVRMAVYKTVDSHPNQNCFTLSSDDLNRFPDEFLDDLNSAAQEEFHEDPQIHPPGVYTGYSMTVKKDLVLDLVKKYNFNETRNVSTDNIASLPDSQYFFDCFFDYDEKQYMFRLEFQPQMHDSNFVNVNVTKNDSDIPHIINNNIVVFYGGFNSTVLFHNDLDTEITLFTDEPTVNSVDENDGDIHENRFAKTLSDFETIIPPGKFFSYYFSPYKDKNDLPISYGIKPFNLEGTVTVKPYPRCMTENEVTSLYGTAKVYPKFPKYLPEGYTFECGVHNTNAFVHFVYLTDEQRSKIDDVTNAAFSREFFADNGLVVDYYDEAWNGWIEDPNYDKFEKAQENSQHPKSKTLVISGQPAVMIKDYFWKDGQQQSFNRLEVFLDEEQIRIKSGLPEEELIKIAESIIN